MPHVNRAAALALALCSALSGCDEDPADLSQNPEQALVRYSSWSNAIRVETLPGTHESFNTASLDGCPFISRDGKMMFMASNRAGGLGGIDIWVATRDSETAPWGAPVNVGAPINSPSNDFCPTLAADGQTFFFVSNRAGGCGGSDIYTTTRRIDGTFAAPENLGCILNSTADEESPFPLASAPEGPVLYFSSNRVGGFAPDAPGAAVGDRDVYVSVFRTGSYQTPTLVPNVNSALEDGQPNVRRDGLEIFFYSTREGSLGAQDIYSASRTTPTGTWSVPENLGATVNSSAGETRPSVSWDGTTLYFGSTREGGEGASDIYMTTRARVAGLLGGQS